MSEESDRNGSYEADQRSDPDVVDVDSRGADGEVDDLFTEVDVSEFDAGTPEADGFGAGGGGAEGTVVDKTAYCQRCEHFSAPPEVACRNSGTEIVEQVDVEHFRVRDCPVVEQRAGEVDVLEEIDLHSSVDPDPDADAAVDTDTDTDTDTDADAGADVETDADAPVKTDTDADADADADAGADADADVDGRSGDDD